MTISVIRLWLDSYPGFFTADSTLTRLIWVRVESNLTHDSWVEHNPGMHSSRWRGNTIGLGIDLCTPVHRSLLVIACLTWFRLVMSIGNQKFGIPGKYQYQSGIWYLCAEFFGIFLVFYRDLEYILLKICVNIGIFRHNTNLFGICFCGCRFIGIGLVLFSWKWHLLFRRRQGYLSSDYEYVRGLSYRVSNKKGYSSFWLVFKNARANFIQTYHEYCERWQKS